MLMNATNNLSQVITGFDDFRPRVSPLMSVSPGGSVGFECGLELGRIDGGHDFDWEWLGEMAKVSSFS